MMSSDPHMHGSNDTSPTDSTATREQWAAERAMVAERFAECLRRSGQSGAPRLSFDATRARVPSADGQQSFAVMAYHCGDDTVVVDLEAMFGSPGAVDVGGGGIIALVDGYLLHELGHRRDRCSEIVLRWGWALPAAVVSVGWVVGKLAGRESIAMVSGLVALALFLLWCGVWVPWRRVQERRADAYMADVGGREVSEALLASITRIYDPRADKLRIYDDPHLRRRRVERRLARRRPPV